MNIEAVVVDAIEHFAAGGVISLLDYTTYVAKNPSIVRTNRKKQTLESIAFILDTTRENITPASGEETAQEGTSTNVARPPIDEAQLAKHVETVKDYLRAEGYVKLNVSLLQRVKETAYSLIRNERINNLSYRNKFLLAVVAEIFGDSLIGISHYMHVVKESPIASFARNTYQIPAFFLGLIAGNGLKKGINVFATSRDERKLNATLKRMVQDTPIVEFVLKYQPPEEVRQQLQGQGLELYGTRLTRAGRKLYYKAGIVLAETARDAIDTVTHYRQQREQRRAGEIAATKRRFDDITRGH